MKALFHSRGIKAQQVYRNTTKSIRLREKKPRRRRAEGQGSARRRQETLRGALRGLKALQVEVETAFLLQDLYQAVFTTNHLGTETASTLQPKGRQTQARSERSVLPKLKIPLL